MKRYFFVFLLYMSAVGVSAQSKNTIEVKDPGFTLNGKPFLYTGISFFNAIYNPTFNKNNESRKYGWRNSGTTGSTSFYLGAMG